MKPLATLFRLALVPLFLFAIGCTDEVFPTDATCSPCNADRTAISCTSTLDDCLAAGQGVCGTHALASLDLHADGTYIDYFPGGGTIKGTWTRSGNALTLTPGFDAPVPGVVTVYEDGASCPAVSQ